MSLYTKVVATSVKGFRTLPSTMSPLIFYDIPSKHNPPVCWSPNTWKTRMVLNFKNLDYKTEWVEYPSIQPLLQGVVEPDTKAPRPYTLPAIKLADATTIMDSRRIAVTLDAAHPTPTLRLDSSMLAKIDTLWPKLLGSFYFVYAPLVPPNLLSPVSREYYERTRLERFGKTLAQLHAEEGGEDKWEDARPYFEQLVAFLKENPGPFLDGKEFGYADIVVVSLIQFLTAIDPKLGDRVRLWDPAIEKLYDACGKWMVRSTE